MVDIIFYAQYIASKQGSTGLTVTIDIHRITRADATTSEVVTGGSATEVGDGVYLYRLASADLDTYDYVAIFKTADGSVDQQDIPALWALFTDVWNAGTRTLTQTGVSLSSAVSGSAVAQYNDSEMYFTLTDLGSLVGRTKLWFTVKTINDYNDKESDDEAIIQIEESVGLVRINRAAASLASDGSLTVDDESDGDITIRLKHTASELADLPSGTLKYDVKILRAGNPTAYPLTIGTFTLSKVVTRSIS